MSVGALSLRVLLSVVSALLLVPTPSRARQTDAPRVQTPAPTAPTDADEWGRLISTGEEFSVELPEPPFEFRTTRHVRRTLSDTEKMRVFGVYSGGVVFMVVSYDKPRDGETFDDFAGYAGGWSLGSLVSKGNVTLDGFAGKEYAHPERRAAARVFRAKNKAYLVRAYAKTADDPKVTRFLNSFSLAPKNSGVAIDEAKAEAARIAQAAPGPGTGGMLSIGPGRGKNPGVVPDAGGGGYGPGPPADYNRVFRQNEVVSKVVLVYKPEPSFTEEARQNHVTGTVRLRVVLTSKGKVTNISVVKGLPDGLTESAIYAARHLLFFPATKDGREVSQYVTVEYNFNIY